MRKLFVGSMGLVLGAALTLPSISAFALPTGPSDVVAPALTSSAGQSLRVATFATSLSAEAPGELYSELVAGSSVEANRVADAVAQADPDVVVLTGMDADDQAVDVFRSHYLRGGVVRPSVDYPYSFTAVGVKGQQSGADLDGDRVVGGPGDTWGQGEFAEQGSLVVLSKYPIDHTQIRAVTQLKWQHVSDNQLDRTQLSKAAASSIPVMNNGLWDIPVEVGQDHVHVLAAQTEPGQNQQEFWPQRQHDQLKVIDDYIHGASYARTDDGQAARDMRSELFVLAGTLSQPRQEPEVVGDLAAGLGQDEPLHNEGNYLIPGPEVDVIGQGRVGAAKTTAFRPGPGAIPAVIESSELIFTDIGF